MSFTSTVYAAAGQAPSVARECAINCVKGATAFIAGHKVAVGASAAAVAIAFLAKRYFPENRVVKAGDAVYDAFYARYASVRDFVRLKLQRGVKEESVDFVGFKGAKVLLQAFIDQASLDSTVRTKFVQSSDHSGRKIILATSKDDQATKKTANAGAVVLNLGLTTQERGWLWNGPADYSAVIADAFAQMKA